MIRRITRWDEEGLGPVQVSVCYLSASEWEPLCEITRQLGPFDDFDLVVADADLEARAWAHRLGGDQLTIFDVLGTPT